MAKNLFWDVLWIIDDFSVRGRCHGGGGKGGVNGYLMDICGEKKIVGCIVDYR